MGMTDRVQDVRRESSSILFDALGLETGNTVADLGCGTGWYALAAGQRVGTYGRVVAIDNDQAHLRVLAERVRLSAMPQLRVLRADLTEGVPLGCGCVDVVLLYDVLQLLHGAERERLYGETRRVLKPSGVLSVHVRHLGADRLARLLRGRSLDDIREEILRHGFRFRGEYRGCLWHGGDLVDGRSLTFEC
ncbi:MAG: methyltransferase domain-containing protein [Chitinivibrionales bacterium]|nr:methyltransferase domain-containing protein [Chitinivibrionales bacterium]